jgi:hypothetical protein
MQLAFARQADRIWILNVGDIKPLEIPISHFLDMAYDTPKWSYDSVPNWLTQWATLSFDAGHAVRIVSVLERYGMYAARRKYELMDTSFYSVINYNEADAILAQWQQLAEDAQSIYDDLDDEYRAAFYEMILQPVLGGQTIYQIYINAAKNQQYVEQKRTSANDKAMEVLQAFKEDAKLTQRYHELLDGKWNHILDRKPSTGLLETCTDQSRNPSGISRILAATDAQHSSSHSLGPRSRNISCWKSWCRSRRKQCYRLWG